MDSECVRHIGRGDRCDVLAIDGHRVAHRSSRLREPVVVNLATGVVLVDGHSHECISGQLNTGGG